jgi:hypothetical protein
MEWESARGSRSQRGDYDSVIRLHFERYKSVTAPTNRIRIAPVTNNCNTTIYSQPEARYRCWHGACIPDTI